MGDVDNVLISIKKIESIKSQLNQLNKIIQNEFGSYCGRKNRSINLEIHHNEFDKSIFKRLYSSWRMEDLNNFNGKSVIKIMERNPYVIFFFFFIMIFIIVYLISFILYTKWFKKLLKKFSNSHKNNKDKEEDWVKKNKAYRNSNSTHGTINKDNYNQELDELHNSDENEENSNVINIVKKRAYNLVINLIVCSFLICLIFLGIWTIFIFADTQKGINMNICGLSKTVEQFLIDKCPDTKNVNPQCYSLEHVINDAVSVMNQYQLTKEFVKNKTNLNKNKGLPIVLKYQTGFNMLAKLRDNIDKNVKKLENGYLHTYPVLTKLRFTLDEIVSKGENLLNQAESIIDSSKEEIGKIFNNVDNAIANTVHNNVPSLSSKISGLGIYIKKQDENLKIRYILNKFTVTMIILSIVILLFSLLVLIGMLSYMYFLIRGHSINEKFFSKLLGFFSGTFGFLAIIILIIGTALLSLSVLGGTSCIISDRILKNEFTFDFLSENKIGYCLQNPDESIINKNIVKKYANTLDSLNTNDIYNSVEGYSGYFDKIKDEYKQHSKIINENMWIIIPTDNNKYVKNVKSDIIKKSLLGTCLTKESAQFEEYHLMGTDAYMKYINKFGLLNNYEMCFEDPSCENNDRKYNINYNSKVTDPKYLDVKRNRVMLYQDSDFDNVLEVFILKSKINNDKIFNISDLDETKKEDITWREYTPKNGAGENKKSIVQTYFEKAIEYMKFENVLTLLKEVNNHINSFKNVIIEKANSLVDNTNCNRFINVLTNIRHNYCDNGILKLTRLSVILISCGFVSFCLWYLFLFFWIYHQMKII
ncbi:hypothetical protein YYC_02262 [Plasmodium yoelii 17X]|uniref:Uncharacterized protein n=1 Tax=Plasmodium yoelii 17X TaxID=1323249 RepID=V7PPI1_PLAYE|nr:hypothetical protein YYC_02262 [Plasmodium yoelii 17X]